jgi:hypothetical protein
MVGATATHVPLRAAVATTVGSVLAALHCGSFWSSDICSLVTLFSFYDVKLYNFAISDASEIFPGVVLDDCSLMDKNIFFGVISVNEAISALDVEPFYTAGDFSCDDFLFGHRSLFRLVFWVGHGP